MSAPDFWAHVTGPRAVDFERVFGTSTVAIKSPFPHVGDLPGLGKRKVYLLDLDWVKEQGRWHDLAAFLAGRFGRDENDVEANLLEKEGVPILAQDVTVRVDHPQRWF